jgi:D-sedoheptulose 7-phosphate isomerase
MQHLDKYMDHVAAVARSIDRAALERLAKELVALRERGGRLFLLGVGGSAANCSHAVNDFRKLCGIEAYTPVDNVSELSARTNDEGWATVFVAWLRTSRISDRDAILVFSVGGGDAERNISPNIVEAVREAKTRGARVLGVLGRDGGYTAQEGDVVVVVPTVDPSLVTPLSEAFQAVVWHGLVSHPALAVQAAKWESAVR